jgi:hypothetical protein
MSASFTEIKQGLVDLSPAQLKEVKVLATHLLGQEKPTAPDEVKWIHRVVCSELEGTLGCGVMHTLRLQMARSLWDAALKSVPGLAEKQKPVRQVWAIITALFNCMRTDGRELSWYALKFYIDNLGDMLEREYPHYRRTGILNLS